VALFVVIVETPQVPSRIESVLLGADDLAAVAGREVLVDSDLHTLQKLSV
jgi:hypothetical protein